ncbi:S-layer homology domain-containing protein [Fusibacter sp. JL216-2]|uniref:S-layer homology domain-containing protein n=1 Tax=Fusibacter sp. JL216-2 TaxID=3071453 RepID=UPI003D337854
MKRIVSVFLVFVLALGMFTNISLADAFSCDVNVKESGQVDIVGTTESQYESGSIIVRDPNESVVYLGQFRSGDDWSFSHSFNLSEDALEGTYSAEIGLKDQAFSESFKVVLEDQDNGDDDSSGGDSGSGGSSKPTHIYISVKGPDGYILSTKQIKPQGNDTVHSIAVRAFKQNDIEYNDGRNDDYFSMIGGVSHFDHGPLSGWKYTINGITGDGVAIEPASAGDRIKFYYVINYKNDDKDTTGTTSGGGASTGGGYTSETHPNEILKKLKTSAEKKIDGSNAKIYRMAALNSIKDMVGNLEKNSQETDEQNIAFIIDTVTESMIYEESVFSATVTAKQLAAHLTAIEKVSDEDVKVLIANKKALLSQKLVERATTAFVKTVGFKLRPGYLEVPVEESLKDMVKSYDENIDKVQDTIEKSGLDKRVLKKKTLILEVKDGKKGYEIDFNEQALSTLKQMSPQVVEIRTDKGSIALETRILEDVSDSFKLQIKEEIKVRERGEDNQEEPVFELGMEKNGQTITKFSKPVTVTIPLQHSSEGLKTVYYIKADGTREIIGGLLNEDQTMMTFKTNHFSKFVVDTLDISFEDIEGDGNRTVVEQAVSRGILSGRDEKSFDPYSTVTRAEMVTMLQNMTKLLADPSETSFEDVKEDDWFNDAVMMAVQYGYMSGRSASTFDPYGKLTLEEVAVVVSNVMEENELSTSSLKAVSQAADGADVSVWAMPGLANAMEFGLIGVDGENNIHPKRQVTRLETATILNKLYTLLEK